MHTDHSGDCATPVEVLLATAQAQGLGAIAVTDHNEVSGALEARDAAELRRQGDRRRGGQDRQPGRGHRPVHRGEDPARADAGRDRRGDQAPGRARLRPAPVRPHARGARLRAPARRSSRTSTRSRSTTRASRSARSTRRPSASPPSTGSSAGAGSDSHVAQGLGSVRVRMRDFDGPEEFLESLRDGGHPHEAVEPALRAGAEVPRDEGHAAGRAAGAPRAPRPARDPQGADARGRPRPCEPSKLAGPMPATDDEIREKYLERAIRELNALTRELQSCAHCPRGNLMPVLGSGHPQADVFLLKYAPRRVGGRGGRRVLRPRGHGADEVAQAARRSTRSPSTGRCASSARWPTPRSPTRRASRASSRSSRSSSRRSSSSWATTRSTVLNDLDIPLAKPVEPEPGVDPAAHAAVRRARRAEHRRGARRGGRQARVLVGVQGARRVVRGPAALLAARARRAGLLPRRRRAARPQLARRGDRRRPRRVGLAFVVALAAAAGAAVPRRSASCPLVARRAAARRGARRDARRGGRRRRSRRCCSAALGVAFARAARRARARPRAAGVRRRARPRAASSATARARCSRRTPRGPATR